VSTRLAVLATLLIAFPTATTEPAARWWADDVEQALAKAKGNRSELEKALAGVPRAQRPGLAFLVANMPDGDLTALKADFLLTNTRLAYQARAELPWGKDIPEDIFLNDVLPYANVDERRDAWRQEFYDLCVPLVQGCKTPSEAAMKLNAELFGKLKLGYSTQRKAPNQSPKESIERGKASCTGLSIVLSDACRAVCVPARIAGTPLWANKRGNHTWVEVWDKGWHFTGACEQDPKGLDRGWFIGDAAQAKKDSFEHAIYAASFRRTNTHFPLVWAIKNKDVPAENVTDRYARPAPKKADTVRVLVRVVNSDKARVAAAVTVTAKDDPKAKSEGRSRDEKADANDLLAFDLQPNRVYFIRVAGDDTVVMSPAKGEKLVEIQLIEK
jgi:hypothetical protein